MTVTKQWFKETFERVVKLSKKNIDLQFENDNLQYENEKLKKEKNNLEASDWQVLSWIYDRLVFVYEEKPSYDYMRRFKKTIDKMQEEVNEN